MPTSKKSTPASPPEGRLDDVLGYQLARAAIRTEAVFFEVAGRPLELRPVEYTILSLILENDGLAPARLAETLAVTAPNISSWIARLEKRGLVARVASAVDRRAQELSLTAQGATIARDATQRLIQAERAAFERLSPGEYLLLRELLQKVADSPAG